MSRQDAAIAEVSNPPQGLARAAKAPFEMVIMLGGLTALGPLSIDMYLPALPSITRQLHGGDFGAQLTVSAFFVGLSLGQLVYGPLSDRIGRRGPLLFGLALYLLATLCALAAPSMPWLIGCRVLQALGACAGIVIARAMVRDRFASDEVLHVFALLSLVAGLSPVIAPLIGGWILLVGDWRWIFGAQATLTIVMLIGVLTRLPESLSDQARSHAQAESPLKSYGLLIRNRPLLGHVLVGAFSGAALYTYVSCSPTVLIGHFHISPQAFGWIFGVNALGLVAGAQVNSRLARRVQPDAILRVANRLALAFAVILFLSAQTGIGGFAGVAVPLFVIVMAMGFNQPNAIAGALNQDPRRAGATSSLLGASAFAVGACSSALAGLFTDGTPRPMAAAVLLTSAVSFLSVSGLLPKPAKA